MTKKNIGKLMALNAQDKAKIDHWLKEFREVDLSWLLGVSSLRASRKRGMLREPVLIKMRALKSVDVAAACAPVKRSIVYPWQNKTRIPLPEQPTAPVKLTCPLCGQEKVVKR